METMSREAAQELIYEFAAAHSDAEQVSLDFLFMALGMDLDLAFDDPTLSGSQVQQMAEQLAEAPFGAVRVQPTYAPVLQQMLADSQSMVEVSTTVGSATCLLGPIETALTASTLIEGGVSALALPLNIGPLGADEDPAIALEVVGCFLGACQADMDDECACGCHGHDDDCDCGCHEHDGDCACGCHGHDDECDCGCHEHDDDDADGILAFGSDDADVLADGPIPSETSVIIAVDALDAAHLCRVVDMVSEMRPDYIELASCYDLRPLTVDDVRLASSTVEPGVEIRVAMPVSTFAEAFELIGAGASRVLTPHAFEVLDDFMSLAAFAFDLEE